MAQPQPDGFDPGFLALAAGYQAQTVELRAQVERMIRVAWRALGVYRKPQQAAFVRDVVPRVLGVQRQMSSLTTAFLAHQRQQAIGGRLKLTPPAPKTVTGEAARLGTPPPEVYGRPFHLVWRQLDELPREPGSIDKATQAGEDRAVSLALDDLQLAKNHTQAEVAKRDDQVKYVERILEGPHSCGLCIVASTQRYHPGRLLPLHGGCDCGQVFKYADQAPGQILHLDRLQDIHDRIEERFGQSSPGARTIPGTASNFDKALQYRDVLVVHDHGELGPILSVKGAEFIGPGDLT